MLNLLLLAALLVILTATTVWFIMRRGPAAISTVAASAAAPGIDVLTVRNDRNEIILQSSEIASIPTFAKKLSPDHALVRQAAHLSADIFKGIASVPGKSISLVFKPEIQAGLKDGSYTLMKTTVGETLADAIDASGKIVGKARVVETGKLRQLASGGFQLASIVVAQSHLADIERSLTLLRQDMALVLDDLESSHIANITGSTHYLSALIDHIKQQKSPGELPSHLASSLQHIVSESFKWRDKLHEDLAMLISRVAEQSDPDTWGTEGAHKALSTHIDKAEELLQRHQKLTHLMATVNYSVAYIDPKGIEFFRVNMNQERWTKLSDELVMTFRRQATQLLDSGRFNSADTLKLRKKDIVRDAEAIHQKSIEQQSMFDTAMQALETNVRRYFGAHADTHLALSFDANGAIKEAAIL